MKFRRGFYLHLDCVRYHEHVERHNLTRSNNRSRFHKSFSSGRFTCNERDTVVGKTTTDLLKLILLDSLFLLLVQLKLSLVDFPLYVVVRQFVRSKILQRLFDGGKLGQVFLVGLG